MHGLCIPRSKKVSQNLQEREPTAVLKSVTKLYGLQHYPTATYYSAYSTPFPTAITSPDNKNRFSNGLREKNRKGNIPRNITDDVTKRFIISLQGSYEESDRLGSLTSGKCPET
jgi:hypothetical protein